MIEIFITTLFLLCVGHAIADYPLQGDFLAKGKNHTAPLPGVPWWQCLTAHAVIHSGFVFAVIYFMGGVLAICLALAMLEFGLHWCIDYLKSDGNLTYNQDQSLHIASKVIIAGLFMLNF